MSCFLHRNNHKTSCYIEIFGTRVNVYRIFSTQLRHSVISKLWERLFNFKKRGGGSIFLPKIYSEYYVKAKGKKSDCRFSPYLLVLEFKKIIWSIALKKILIPTKKNIPLPPLEVKWLHTYLQNLPEGVSTINIGSQYLFEILQEININFLHRWIRSACSCPKHMCVYCYNLISWAWITNRFSVNVFEGILTDWKDSKDVWKFEGTNTTRQIVEVTF